MRGKAILLAALLAMALVPAIAAAQATSGSFADLARSERLHEGKDITITFRYGASVGYEEGYRSNTLPEQLSSHIEWSVTPVIVKDRKAAVFTIKW